MPDFDLDAALCQPTACPACGYDQSFRRFIGIDSLQLRYDDSVTGPVRPVIARACLNQECRAPLRLEFMPEWSSLAEEQGVSLERCMVRQCPDCRGLRGAEVEVGWMRRALILPRAMLGFDCQRCNAAWATRYRPSHYTVIG